jgi:hypothetical protein
MNSRQSRRLKEKFIEHYRVLGNITSAAALAAIPHRSIVYEWQEHDDAFAAAFREAELVATEHLEHEARRRAVEGVVTETPIYSRTGELLNTIIETKYSDTLLIFLLKARAPEKYRERFDVTTAGQPMIKQVEADLAAVL